MTSDGRSGGGLEYSGAFAVGRLSYQLGKKNASDVLLECLYQPNRNHASDKVSSWILANVCNSFVLVGAVFDVLDWREYALASNTPDSRCIERSHAETVLAVVRAIETIGARVFLEMFDGKICHQLDQLCVAVWGVNLESIGLTEQEARKWVSV